MEPWPTPPTNLTDISIAQELSRRIPRSPDLQAENRALQILARQLATSPHTLLKTLVAIARDLCRAGSVGICLLTENATSEPTLRWEALAGAWEGAEQTNTPRTLSGSGADIDFQTPQLYLHPEQYLQDLLPGPLPIAEALVVPLYAVNQTLGAIWIVSHDSRQFDAEDLRIAIALADFAVAALQIDRTASALRDRETHLQLILDSAKDYTIFTLETGGHFTSWNAGAERMLGYAEAEIVGQHGRIIFTPEDSAARKPELEMRLALTEGKAENERWHLRKDGSRFWGSGLVMPLRDAAGELQGFLKIMQDKTERRQAEEALRQSENRYRTLADAVPQLMWSNTADGRLEFCNQHWQSYTGWMPELPVTATMLEIFHPLDLPALVATRHKAIAAGEAYEFECRVLRFDGIYRWHLVRVVPIKDRGGQVVQWVGIGIDIDDRKQAEESLAESDRRFRFLAESLPHLIWNVDTAGEIRFANQKWSEYLGMSYEEAVQNNWESLMPPSDLAESRARWQECQIAGEVYQVELRLRRAADQMERWHLSRAVPIRDAEGEIVEWIGTNTDIHDRLKAEAERERLLAGEKAAREEAERANRVKDEFLAVLSHELRTPLNPILGWAKLLRSNCLTPEKQRYALETIERNAKLQTQLIEDLLDVSGILQGKVSLNIVPVDLAGAIGAAIETVRLSAQVKSIQISTEFALNIGLVLGDGGRLQQVMWNLLSNAVKFTPPGGKIAVKLDRVDSDAQITVTDTGTGIEPDFLPYVFDYFRQADSTYTRKFGGFGLGLAIVRHLVELHGGTVKSDSAGEGKGATFTVRIPLMPVQPPTIPAATPPEKSFDLSGIRVLAVDDDADARDLVVFLLEDCGATVTAVSNAADALAALTLSVPDLLLSDVGMPDTDGYMLLRQVRALPADRGGLVPAIALTAYAGEIDYRQALAAGFQRHLSKPLDPDKLLQAMVDLLVERSAGENIL